MTLANSRSTRAEAGTDRHIVDEHSATDGALDMAVAVDVGSVRAFRDFRWSAHINAEALAAQAH